MTVENIGALFLGAVIGYLAHFVARRNPTPKIGDLGTIIGVILGGAVFKVITGPEQTSWYLIGLGLGFFLYLVALFAGGEKVKQLSAERQPLPLLPFLKK
jgi:ABC-type uncharacterized transport system permease subunit